MRTKAKLFLIVFGIVLVLGSAAAAVEADSTQVLVAHGLPPLTWSPGPPGTLGRPVEHVFDDVVVVSTGEAAQFEGRVGPAWSPIPTALFEAILVEHGIAPTVAA